MLAAGRRQRAETRSTAAAGSYTQPPTCQLLKGGRCVRQRAACPRPAGRRQRLCAAAGAQQGCARVHRAGAQLQAQFMAEDGSGKR